MFCPKCGVENADDKEQCASCNWALSGSTAQPVIEAKTSRLAIATLILGILIITAIPAFICGIIALVRIGKSNGQLKGKGLAITGMMLPIILLVILTPTLFKVKRFAYRMVCPANLKTLSTAAMAYSVDFEDKFPTSENWCDLLMNEADVATTSFHTPFLASGTYFYGFNKNLEGLGFDNVDLSIVMMFEIEGGKNVAGGPELMYTGRNNNAGCYVAFVDGYVEFIGTENFDKLKWTVDE